MKRFYSGDQARRLALLDSPEAVSNSRTEASPSTSGTPVVNTPMNTPVSSRRSTPNSREMAPRHPDDRRPQPVNAAISDDSALLILNELRSLNQKVNEQQRSHAELTETVKSMREEIQEVKTGMDRDRPLVSRQRTAAGRKLCVSMKQRSCLKNITNGMLCL